MLCGNLFLMFYDPLPERNLVYLRVLILLLLLVNSGTRGCKACEKFFPKLGHPQDGFHIGFPPHLVAYRPTDKGGCRS